MNRRNFFAVITGLVASLMFWRRGDAMPVGSSDAELSRFYPPSESSESWLSDGTYPPIVYDGDRNDPNYFCVGDGKHNRREGLACFIDGVDRNMEVYECYVGEKGWANIVVKYRSQDGKLRCTRIVGPWINGNRTVQFVHAGIRGRITMEKPLHVRLSEHIQREFHKSI